MPPVQIETTPCALCGATTRRPLFTSRDTRYEDTPRDEFTLVECVECGLRYLCPRPAPESLGLFYPPQYYAPRLVSRDEMRRARRDGRGLMRRLRPTRKIRQLEEKVRHVRRLTPAAGRVLEIGPGGGDFLVALEDEGYAVTGLDRDQAAIRTMRDRLAVRVVHESEADAAIAPGSVDTVALWNAFEHVSDPAGVLRRIRGWLRPGGHVVLSVPNGSALERSLFFRGDPCEDIPRHLFSFTPKTLRDLFVVHGFDRVGFRHGTLCSASELQFRTEGRWVGAGRIPPGLYAVGILPAFWILDRVFGLAGRSHTVVAWARKPAVPPGSEGVEGAL